ncbi:MAG: alpha-L-fucosidase [Candidatus Marinimicrobia bacterium]|nr:alpha-L-fucosidase [Candidatus Neomarinimicrobiota bacterium]MCF7828208.1 alpha-L-fucosidase [Candidatus Neomarinimicrobiota bacterium]MCF7879617.1 alpha-L-fucosidase [Candidatus Neomarinimicrobiota bacterium]
MNMMTSADRIIPCRLILVLVIALPAFISGQETEVPGVCTAEHEHFRDRLEPAPVDGGFRMEDYWIWGASVIKGDDGRYHMFASRWPRALPFTPHWLTNSEIVRAVSDTPEGPYEFQEVVLPPRGTEYWDGKMTHNPVIRKVDDTYLLFYTGTTYDYPMPTPDNPTTSDSDLKLDAHKHERIGLATAKSVTGPWKRRDEPILDVRPGTWERYLVSNASPLVKPDGTILLYYKGVAKLRHHAISVAKAEHFEGPYQRIFEKPFDVGVGAEDPTMWYENGKYHALMMDTQREYSPKEIYYASSEDGMYWETAPNPVTVSKHILFEDGEYRRRRSTERPQILVENGKATHVFFATAEVVDGRRHTWNMVIPLKTQSEVKDRLAWWRKSRVGLSVIWGLYSAAGDGSTDIPGEDMMKREQISVDEYFRLTEQWDPGNFNPETIVSAAKNAGMRYIVFSAKLRDGFAMFNSETSSYNVARTAEIPVDPVAALAEECRKQGVKFGLSYSLGTDWHYTRSNMGAWEFADSSNADYENYIEEKVNPQIRELLTNYGQIDLLVFDSPGPTTIRQSIELEMTAKRLQPDLIVNTGLGNGVGDYCVLNQKAAPTDSIPAAWELTGFVSGKQAKAIVQEITETAGYGGNYRLQISLDSGGSVPEVTLSKLNSVGKMVLEHEEAIYGRGSRE